MTNDSESAVYSPKESPEPNSDGYNTLLLDPSDNPIELWNEVAMGVDKSHTVAWTRAVSSLKEAKQHLDTSPDARRFVDRYMLKIVNILLKQLPTKIGWTEEDCVESSLKFALLIVAQDLKATEKPSSGDCTTLNVLASIFDKRHPYYENPSNLCPEVQMYMFEYFRRIEGFQILSRYLRFRAGSPQFPSLDILHILMLRVGEAHLSKMRKFEFDEVKIIHEIVMNHLIAIDGEMLKQQCTVQLIEVFSDLDRIYYDYNPLNGTSIIPFFDFIKSFAVKLMASNLLAHRFLGYKISIPHLIDVCHEFPIPPSCYIVEEAGMNFVNGRYDLSMDGLCYERVIPNDFPDNSKRGKLLRMSRRTVQWKKKLWFFSEVDEEQPGNDKNVDYYRQSTEMNEEEHHLPSYSWETCKRGFNPPPKIIQPPEERLKSLEHQLAKWITEENVIGLVVRHPLPKRGVRTLRTLFEFLRGVCSEMSSDQIFPPQYIFDARYLLSAWNFCLEKSKGDDAVLLRLLTTKIAEVQAKEIDSGEMKFDLAEQKSDGTSPDAAAPTRAKRKLDFDLELEQKFIL